MNKVFFEEYGKENMNAGFKARKDVCDIINSFKGITAWDVSFTIKDDKGPLYKLLNYIKIYLKLLFFKKGSTLIVQYPCRKLSRILSMFNSKFKIIAIVHDIEGIRNMNSTVLENDVNFLNKCSTVISHNKRMSQKLKDCGAVSPKYIELNLFDYLCDERKEDIGGKGICFAGNIDKSSFIKYIPQNLASCGFNLYGLKTQDFDFVDGINYCGAYDSNTIVSKLQGLFALVWDGDSVNTCTGLMGEYTKYNNPHKLSLYVAAGIPVIVWEKAAIADLVKEKEIGFTVASLTEIPYKLSEINVEQYNKFKKNVKVLQEKAIKGFFLKTALAKALGDTENE